VPSSTWARWRLAGRGLAGA